MLISLQRILKEAASLSFDWLRFFAYTSLTLCRKFTELGALLMAKACSIKPSTIVRLWRPSVLALCTYLCLAPIKE